MATAVATNGFQPLTMSAAATAPPSGKLPSTVRSGKLMIRNERKTPSATSPNIRPISMAPSDAMSDMWDPRLLDDDLGRLDEFVRQRHALLRRGSGIHVQLERGARLRGDLARGLALEDAHDDLSRLAADVVVVQAQRRHGAAIDGVGVGRNHRDLGLLGHLDDAL